MDCDGVREAILDALVEPLAQARRAAAEAHLAGCPACAEFAQEHRLLDERLDAAILTPQLSPAFRASLKSRMMREADSAWPDSLPDVAHLIGCVFAVLLSLVVLQPGMAILLGLVFTCVTYFLQAALRSSLD